jgi:3-hydroxybutyryl-CoA dehydratase
MSDYTFDELIAKEKSGERVTASYSIGITNEMHEMFIELLGNPNPVHIDDEYAIKHGFRERVCYSYMTTALLSQMTRLHTPGGNGVCHGIDMHYHMPVYIGDTLHYEGALSKVRKSIRRISIDVTVTNQKQDIVAKAKMDIGYIA